MSLNGRIHTMSVPDLLQWLECTCKTGAVTLVRDERASTLYVRNGRIAAASVGLELAATEVTIRQVLAECLPWSDGEFEFIETSLPDSIVRVDAKLDTSALIFDVFRERDESKPDKDLDETPRVFVSPDDRLVEEIAATL